MVSYQSFLAKYWVNLAILYTSLLGGECICSQCLNIKTISSNNWKFCKPSDIYDIRFLIDLRHKELAGLKIKW